MNNVVDEILQDEPVYRILDNEGNIILDNISIEMITAISQVGTALNKALFDSIKNDLIRGIGSRVLCTISQTSISTSYSIDTLPLTQAQKIGQGLSVSNNRVVVGSGVEKIKISFNVGIKPNNGGEKKVYIYKNSNSIYSIGKYCDSHSTDFGDIINSQTVLSVNSGDVIEIKASGSANDVILSASTMIIESW